MAYRDYSTAHGHIVDASGQGDFTTLGAAMVAAVAGDTIFLRPGSYGGGIGLTPGVNICSFGCEGMLGSPPNVEITGTLTLNGTGTVNIYGINFNVSGNALVLSGSGASFLNVENCYFTMDISTGLSFTNSNISSAFNLRNCAGNTGSVGVAVWGHSGTGTLNFYDCDFSNLGSSTAANGCLSGSVNYYRGTLGTQVNFTAMGNGFFMGVDLDTSPGNTTSIVSDGVAVIAFNCILNSGSATAATVSTGLVLSQCFIDSSATDAISGTGTLFYSDLTFGSSNLISVTSLAPQSWQPYATYTTPGTSLFDVSQFTVTDGLVSLIGAGPVVASTSFLPVLSGSGSSGTIAYTNQVGGYTQIGSQVTYHFLMTGAITGVPSGNVQISLPVTPNSSIGGLAQTGPMCSTEMGGGSMGQNASIDPTNTFLTCRSASSLMQIATGTFNLQGSITYLI